MALPSSTATRTALALTNNPPFPPAERPANS